MYLLESISNIIENIKSVIFMMSFLVIWFTGITFTDSMRYCTSLQTLAELNVNGDEVLSVEFKGSVIIVPAILPKNISE